MRDAVTCTVVGTLVNFCTAVLCIIAPTFMYKPIQTKSNCYRVKYSFKVDSDHPATRCCFYNSSTTNCVNFGLSIYVKLLSHIISVFK